MNSSGYIVNFPISIKPRPERTVERISLIPRVDQRLLICGSTGSGKSVFASKLLLSMHGNRPIAILDPKGEDRLIFDNAHIITRATDIFKWKIDKNPTILYRPNGLELLDYPLLDSFLQYIFDTGTILTYIDELSAMGQRHIQRAGLTNLLSRGRARNRNGYTIHSPLWLSTQRPRGIPLSAITEADRIVMFRTNHMDDRKTIAADTHPDFTINPTKQFGFKLYDRQMTSPLDFNPLKL